MSVSCLFPISRRGMNVAFKDILLVGDERYLFKVLLGIGRLGSRVLREIEVYVSVVYSNCSRGVIDFQYRIPGLTDISGELGVGIDEILSAVDEELEDILDVIRKRFKSEICGGGV